MTINYRNYISENGIDYNRAYWDAMEEMSERQAKRQKEIDSMPNLPDPWKASKVNTQAAKESESKKLSVENMIKLGALGLAVGSISKRGKGSPGLKGILESLTAGDKPQPYTGFGDAFKKSVTYGTGQTLQDIGHGMQWKDKDKLGAELAFVGQMISAGNAVEGIDIEKQQEMGVKVYLKPQWWATDMATSLPAQTPLMAAGIAPAIAGGLVGGPAGGVIGAAAGTAISRPGESFLEAGQAYDAAKQMGYDEDIAKQVADTVYKENLKLAAADIPELVLTFAKVPKPLAKFGTTPLKRAMVTLGVGGTKIGVDFVKEAAEEFAQENIQSKALAQEPHSFGEDLSRFVRPSTWTPEEASAALAGGAMGGLFGGAGVVTDIARSAASRGPITPQASEQGAQEQGAQERGQSSTQLDMDAFEDKLVSEYGKLLDTEAVDTLSELKQVLPEIEKRSGVNSDQAAEARAVRIATTGQMFMDVTAALDSYITEATQKYGAESAEVNQLQTRKTVLEQAAPQMLTDAIQEVQKIEARQTGAEMKQEETATGQAGVTEPAVEAEQVEATGAEQAEATEQAATPEQAEVELSQIEAPGVEAVTEPIPAATPKTATGDIASAYQVGDRVTWKGAQDESFSGMVTEVTNSDVTIKSDSGEVSTFPSDARGFTKVEASPVEKTTAKAVSKSATAVVPQLGKFYEVTHKGATHAGKVVVKGKANAVIQLNDGRKLTIPVKADWKEVKAVSHSAAAKTTATYTVNKDNNTVTVSFPSKPSKDATSKLHAAGFKYGRKNKTWSAEQTPERIALARELAGETAREAEKKSERKLEPTAKEPEKEVERSPAEKSEGKAEEKTGTKGEQVVAPESLQELLEQMTKVSPTKIGQEQTAALGALIEGVARYRGMTTDEYIKKRFSGVIEGGDPAENALFRRMEQDDKSITAEPAGKEFKEPKKTVKAYKMFRTLKSRPGEIFPLFIGKTKPTPIGKWIPAEFLPTKGYAQRPGWHAGVLPYAPHLMKKDGTMQAGRVWAEVEIPADVDWQDAADKSRTHDIRDAIPEGGNYRFKTNKMQGGAWIIGGAIKINKILSMDEVRSIVKEHGIDTQFKVIDGVPIAAVEFSEDTKALIRALNAPNVADMAHELGHVFRRDLSEQDLAIVEDWAEVLDGAWDTRAEEKFADGFVEYLAEGKSPTKKLEGVFEKFKQWIAAIFKSIKNREEIELSTPVREVFDRLISGEDLTKKPALSPLEQELTNKGIEFKKNSKGNLLTGYGLAWAKDKWDRDTAMQGTVGVFVSNKEGYFALESSFSDKDTIKKLGAKWGPQIEGEKLWHLPKDKLIDLMGSFENVQISEKVVSSYGAVVKEQTGLKGKEAPSTKIAALVTDALDKGEVLDSKQLFKMADEAYEGTQAEGKYTPKDAYDALELGVNKYIEQQGYNSEALNAEQAKETLASIQEGILEKIPTQTKRTEEQKSYQQFSTPPNIAFTAAWVANIKAGETVLEPSAGVGGLAVFAKNAGAKVVVNELSDRRVSLLRKMDFEKVFTENAEQIDNILPSSIKPTTIIMNPPFSATAGRMGEKRATRFAKTHIEQALKRLEPNGRLVAIVGRGMADNTAAFRSWWGDIKAEYNVLANIGIEGTNYKKYGTSFDVQLVVIDKTGAAKEATRVDTVTNLNDILPILEEVRNERVPVGGKVEQISGKPDSQKAPSKAESENDAGGSLPASADKVGTGSQTATTGRTGELQPDVVRTGRPDRGTDVSDASAGSIRDTDGDRSARGDATSGAEDTEGTGTGRSSGVRTKSTSDVKTVKATKPRVGETEITIEQIEEQAQAEDEEPGSVYAVYRPQKMKIVGAQPHPGDLVQSAAMAAVEPPDLTYVPHLPKDSVTKGKLSDAQLEPIAYAGQNFEKTLADGMRKGYFVGDGTGVGKGRIVSGIIMDSMRQGAEKAVWVSKNNALFKDARRDFKGAGGDEKILFMQNKTKTENTIKSKNGIVFTTYYTLGSGLRSVADEGLVSKKGIRSRIDQLVDWLGEDYDGVIAFDEAHQMRNCIEMESGGGKSKVAVSALAGIELARRFPKAKVLYLSATGGVEVADLAYAERLGLWGEGTAFANKKDFISQIDSGGVAAMEVVARDMKAMGDYISRNLSYKDVTFTTMEHKLDETQTEIYDTAARAWQVILQNIDAALAETNAQGDGRARARALAQFWGSQQRFFNQVLTAMQMPSVIDSIKKDLKDGKSAVLQIVNTNAAAQEREITKRKKQGDDLEKLDLTPRETVIEFLKKSFPVQQYEPYIDEDHNERARPVVDSEGKPVLNKQAVARRDALIGKLGAMRIPDGPLDMLLNVFGAENVAEVTSRPRRVVQVTDEATGERKSVIESRSASSGPADVKAFMDGKKRILVFSEAGGTGASYHADNAAKNRQPRVHYLLQAGWSAPKAVQGFGRTNRTNQAHAPHYVLVTTDLKGHKRFISTIARRLDQLGALTKGQRQAGSQGMFSAADNLESDIAKDALDTFYGALVSGIDGLPSGQELLKMIGMDSALLDRNGNLLESPSRKNTSQFLNRILVLESELQNKVFDSYYSIVEEMTQKALADGTLDRGLEDYRRDKVTVADERVVYTDPETGAETKYIEIDAGNKSKPIPFEAAKKMKGLVGFYQNNRSKRVYAYKDMGRTTTLKNGHVVKVYERVGQELARKEVIDEEAFNDKIKANLETKLTQAEAEPLWNEAHSKIPEYNMEKVHLISGALLPIWDRLPKNRMRVLRVYTNDGQVFLGRIIEPRMINTVLHKLGADTVKTKRTVSDLKSAVLENGESLKLANGWEIERRRVAGEHRIELVGDDLWRYVEELKKVGVFTEEINYQVRFFIPTSDKGADVIEKIVKRRPIVDGLPSLDEILDKDFSDKVNEAMPEEPPKAGFSVYDISRHERNEARKDKFRKDKPEPYCFDDPEVEARWNAAKIPKEAFLDRVKEFWSKFWRQATREFEFLPDTPEFEKLRNKLLQLRTAKGVAREKTYRIQQGITINLDSYTFDIFTRKVILDDMMEDVKLGVFTESELPFGLTTETLPIEHKRVTEAVAKYPDADAAIKDRRKAQRSLNKDYIKAMSDIGFKVEDRLLREDYYHHQVIAYAAAKNTGSKDVKGTGKNIQRGTLKGRGFLKQRKGSILDYNTDYVVAEYEVMAQMLYDIKVAEVIKVVDSEYNIRKQLDREAAEANQRALDAKIEAESKKGIDTTEKAIKGFKRKKAMSFAELRRLAEKGELWDDGKWSAVINKLALGVKETPGESSGVMRYLSEVAKVDDRPGNMQARTIFKAIAEEKKFTEDTLGAKFVTYKDLIPEGYVAHAIEEGHVFYFANSIPERIVDQLTDHMLTEIGISLEDIQRVRASAGTYPAMIVKEEIANTLSSFNKPLLENTVTQAAKALTRPWKIYVLTAPQKWFKYNIRNVSGDAEAVFVGNPSAFKKVPQAMHELYEVMFKDRPMSKDLREFFERGLFQTVLQAVEVGDLDQLKMFEHIYEKEKRKGALGKVATAPTKVWQTYWKYARLTTDFREAILRYAACLDYLEQMQSNTEGRPKNFGASKKDNVMALDDLYDRAFKLSNELCGAYNRVGVIGQFLREGFIPFWSWNEVNFRRYIQLWRNMWNDGQFSELVGRKTASKLGGIVIKSPTIAFNVGKMTLTTFFFVGALAVWNNLFFGDDEDKLPKDVQLKPHINLGRDKNGKIRYIDNLGMLDDFLEWFGMDEGLNYAYEFVNGRRDFTETVRDMAIAPFNKLTQGVTPLLKLPFELISGVALYPDIRDPGRIYDKTQYLAQQFSLADEYKILKKQPGRSYNDTLAKWLVLKADPGESAYYEVRDLVRDYKKDVLGKRSGNGRNSDDAKSEALYNVKQAMRYNDTKAFEKYLQEYFVNGGTIKGINQSLKALDPLEGLSDDTARDFYRRLTPEEQIKVKRAEEFYRDVLIRTGDSKFDESATRAIDKAIEMLDS